MIELTAKREKFAQEIANGKNQSDAYRAAFSTEKMTDKTVWEKASIVANDDKVRTRVSELREKLADKQLWTREMSVRVLGSLAIDKENNPSARVAAIRELNSMHGFNEPTKFEHSGLNGGSEAISDAELIARASRIVAKRPTRPPESDTE